MSPPLPPAPAPAADALDKAFGWKPSQPGARPSITIYYADPLDRLRQKSVVARVGSPTSDGHRLGVSRHSQLVRCSARLLLCWPRCLLWQPCFLWCLLLCAPAH